MKELLKDKIALITGGTAGIGKAIAQKFVSESAQVIICGTSQERGQDAVEEIKSSFADAQISFLQLDVSNHSAVLEAMKNVLKEHGRVDILVNNAGITKDQLLMKMSESDWDDVMSVNVKSCYNTCHALVRSMMKERKGKIINIGSVVGLLGNPAQANYAASKAAMVGMTKSLAKELAPRGIHVNCIAPGFIVTSMTEVLTEAQKESLQGKIPLARFGNPEEIANAALFLASDLSSYITGQVLTVDGGMAIGFA